MPPFVGAGFRLQSAASAGLATIRVRYTQDPVAVDGTDVHDALNIENYALVGPVVNYVTSVAEVFDDPQAVDLYLAAPLELGEWSITVQRVEAEGGVPLTAPTSLTFAVLFQATQSPVSGGALNDDVVNVLRKFLSPAMKGPGFNSLLAGLATGDATNWTNAKLAFNQLFLSTAKGIFLDRRAGEQGYRRPSALAMPDDLFRQLSITSKASKLTQNAILEVLEVYYGSDTIRASITSTEAQPYALEDGDDLQLVIDEREFVTVVIRRGEFARIGQASAVEVAAAITRDLRSAKSQAYAVARRDEVTGLTHVRVYSGRLGIASSVRVLGGRTQRRLIFPTIIFTDPVGPPVATWTVTRWTQRGRVRFVNTTPETFDLNQVKPGDRVLIYGAGFDLSQNRGTFEVKEVSVSYEDVSTWVDDVLETTRMLVAWFEIENPIGQSGGTVVQVNPDELMFHRAVKHTVYNQPRRVLVTQSGPGVDITIPATTQAVGRTAGTGAYGVVNEAMVVAGLSRDNGTVTVTTDTPHGLAVGDIVIIDGVLPSLDSLVLPPITPGSVSAGDAGGGYSLALWAAYLVVPELEYPVDSLSPVLNFDGLPGATLVTARVTGEIRGLSSGTSVTIRLRSRTDMDEDFYTAPIVGTLPAITTNGLFSVSLECLVPAGTIILAFAPFTESVTEVTMINELFLLEVQ